MRRIGIQMHAKGGLTDEAYVKQIKALGFDATFTNVPTAERIGPLAELFAREGIFWESMHAPFDGINSIWLEGDSGDTMLARLQNGVDACALAGVPVLVVHLSSGLKPPSITDVGRARFAQLVAYAGEKRVQIAFENQRMLGNIAWAFEAFADAPHVGFCYDTGHENCFTPGREYMPLFGKKLVFTHIHDNSGEFDHDEHRIPFDGGLDFDRVARQIRESGYTGTLMLEVIAKNSNYYDDVAVEDYLARAARAIRRLRSMVDEI